MPVGSKPSPLTEILAERIRAHGRITFAEYMEACLYHPQHGYYAKADQQTRCDYVTSVDVTPVFGRLLARQFHEMWALLGRPQPFSLVEAGAATGQLARQILDCAFESLGEFYSALQYVAVERSTARRSVQASNLQEHIARGRFSSRADLPAEISNGCVFSNELLDALAVHRVVREGGELREIYVTRGGNGFCEETGALSSTAIAEYFEQQGIALHEEQMAEVCLGACQWIENAASRLHRGFVLTIDYGHEARGLYDERHMRGTLLAYSRHRASEDFYRTPGEQDLTAHVNFTALDVWGRRGGLVRSGLTSQTNFLLALARSTDFADVEIAGANDHEKTANRLAFKTLIHPEGMGETFSVHGQQKGIELTRLTGFEPL
ncbi:MAG: SAM-dependent methyltransferase [Candidatus Acidiferrales bacterium]